MKLPRPSRVHLLIGACTCALIALPLMVWSIFQPTVWPVMLALSVGQGLGTLSFLAFLWVVARDMQLRRHLRESSAPSLPPERGP